jgi:putative transposase
MVKFFRFTTEQIVNFILQPWQFCFMILASWVNREQQKINEFYQAELEAVLKAQGKARFRLSDDQRRLLAVKGKSLGRKTLMELTTIVTPDTILRWHRTLVAQKWDYSERRNSPGRPRTNHEIVELVLRFARENPSWGYDRIQGALANLDHEVSDQTIGNILKEHGVEPAPDRKRQTTWKTFIKAHWDVLAAIDFTTIEVWTKGGLVTYYLLFVMEVATRRVHFAACTPTLGDEFMKQIGRNLTDPFDGFLRDQSYVLMDRDSHFSSAFRTILKEADVEPVRLPAKSPNLNAHLERFHLSIKSECLARMIFFGEKSLRRAVNTYLTHYHGERNHQGLGNKLIDPTEDVGRTEGEIDCRQQLGGLLNYYYRKAA